MPLKSTITDIRKDIDLKTVSTGTVAAIIACTGPLLIIITASQNGQLSSTQTTSWIFAVYFVAGLIGIIMPLLYKMPIAGAYSVPSAVLMTQAITQFSFQEAVGAYIVAGIFIFLIGYFGWFETIINWLPTEIVMAMIAGSMIHFAIDMIQSTLILPIIGIAALLTYFICAKYISFIPPIVGALLVSMIFVPFYSDSMQSFSFQFEWPSFWVPSFSFNAIFAISIPITVMLLGTEAVQGFTMLKNAGYKPPVNIVTMVSGIGTMLAGMMGGHSACIAGIMTALCSAKETGPKEKRYIAAFFSGILLCIFAIFASIILSLIILIPMAIIKIIAGLALLNFLLSTFQQSFRSGKFQMGAFFAFIFAMSGIHFFGISSTFWALVVGLCVSLFIEKEHFKQRISESRQKNVEPAS